MTEFIPDSVELVDALFDTRRKGAGGAAERLDALREAGSLIHRMAGAGLRHRDLHAGNILLEWRGASPRSYLLDLDRCEIGREGKPMPARPMYQRLCRSLLKWERETGIRLTDAEWKALERATFA